MTSTPSNLTQTAIAWHLRLRDGDDADWAAFADWLAISPDHADAYDAVEAMDRSLDPMLAQVTFEAPAPRAVNDNPPARRWRWVAGGGAMAAALALAVFVGRPASDRYEVTTQPGETQTVQLDAGTQIALNGDTQMTFDHKDPRFARLTHGEALFTVRHDPAHPFTLEMAGKDRVVDVGTVFNVVALPGQTRIAVAQGAVDYQSDGQPIPLHAGQQLQGDPAGGTLAVTPTDPATVDGWRRKRLTYAGNRLEQVAQDLGRMLGAVIKVDPSIAAQPVFGTIDAHGLSSLRIPALAAALNVRVERHGKVWVLKPAHDRTR